MQMTPNLICSSLEVICILNCLGSSILPFHEGNISGINPFVQTVKTSIQVTRSTSKRHEGLNQEITPNISQEARIETLVLFFVFFLKKHETSDFPSKIGSLDEISHKLADKVIYYKCDPHLFYIIVHFSQ